MPTRELGKTGMTVSVIGLGAGQIGQEAVPQEQAEKLLNTMLDDGMNVFDTGSSYGESEEFIGNTVSQRRQEFWLISKCGDTKDMTLEDFTPEKMNHEIDRSLRRLQTDYMDVLFIDTCNKEKLQEGDVIDVVKRAKEKGKTRFIGYSGDGDDAIYAVETGEFDVLEISVSVADQEAIDRGILQMAKDKGMGVLSKRSIANVCWKPDPTQLQDISDYQKRLLKLDYPFIKGDMVEAVTHCLRFALAVPNVDCALVGTTQVDHWKQDLAIVQQGPLSSEEYETIRSRWQEIREHSWKGLG